MVATEPKTGETVVYVLFSGCVVFCMAFEEAACGSGLGLSQTGEVRKTSTWACMRLASRNVLPLRCNYHVPRQRPTGLC